MRATNPEAKMPYYLTRLGWRIKKEGHYAVSDILRYHVDCHPGPDYDWFRLCAMVGRVGQNIRASLLNECITP